jgi:HPt (histidine-containing phosphotransfer) domain-containing protein
MSETIQDKSKAFTIEWGYYQQLLTTIEELRKDLKYFIEVDDINDRLMTRCEQLKNEIAEMKEAPCAFCGH